MTVMPPRRCEDPEAFDPAPLRQVARGNGAAVSKTWLIATLTTVALAGGAGWMSYVHTQIDAMAAEQKKQKDDTADSRRETAVIKEKVERLEKDTTEIKSEQKDQSRKLDELLRRVR